MNRLRTIFVALAFVGVFGTAAARAHEFETGHIERSIDVVIRDRQVQVKYSIGLSDTTILDRLVEGQLISAAEEARFRKCIADLEKAGDDQSGGDDSKVGTTTKVGADKKAVGQDSSAEPAVVASPAERTSAKAAKATGAEKVKKSETSPKASETQSAAEPLEFQTELLTLLQEKLSATIVENLDVNCEGNSLKKVEIAVSNSARHHVSLEIAFSVELPEAEKYELAIVDRNFLDLKARPEGDKVGQANEGQVVDDQELRYFGNIRLACRVKGKVVQLGSNVAPVLARAKPTNVGTLNREQRIEAATIRTRLASPTANHEPANGKP